MALTKCALALLAIALAAGCGNGPSTYTVSGHVTYKGQPVESGLINFQAAGQKPLGGAIDEEGAYEFELPAGTYQVRIDTPPALPPGWKEGDPPPKMGPRQVPEKFGSYATSNLTATVSDQESSQTVDFALE
jgi:hypothetical protein